MNEEHLSYKLKLEFCLCHIYFSRICFWKIINLTILFTVVLIFCDYTSFALNCDWKNSHFFKTAAQTGTRMLSCSLEKLRFPVV